MWEMQLCLALGYRSLHDLRMNFPTDEYPLWLAYCQLRGFDQTRLEVGIANAGAAMCQVMGGKVKPHELVASFKEATLTGKASNNYLSAWKKANQPTRTRKHGSKLDR